MTPDYNQAKALWIKYQLPQQKQTHCAFVAKVAVFLARKCKMKNEKCKIDEDLLFAAALLHDIDKNVPKLSGEQHPDAAVRILREEGMEEVAALVNTHPLHTILDPVLAPKTWEEKLLYLADKMVKYEIITVDKRFALWRAEPLSASVRAILDATYPKVKKLEKEVFGIIGMVPEEVVKFI